MAFVRAFSKSCSFATAIYTHCEVNKVICQIIFKYLEEPPVYMLDLAFIPVLDYAQIVITHLTHMKSSVLVTSVHAAASQNTLSLGIFRIQENTYEDFL